MSEHRKLQLDRLAFELIVILAVLGTELGLAFLVVLAYAIT